MESIILKVDSDNASIRQSACWKKRGKKIILQIETQYNDVLAGETSRYKTLTIPSPDGEIRVEVRDSPTFMKRGCMYSLSILCFHGKTHGVIVITDDENPMRHEISRISKKGKEVLFKK